MVSGGLSGFFQVYINCIKTNTIPHILSFNITDYVTEPKGLHQLTKMKTLTLFFVLCVIVQASLVKSQKTHQCKGHEINFSAEQVAGMKKCGELVGVKTMEEMTPDKLPCFAKCMLESSSLVDGEGKPHKENIMAHIDKSVPKEMADVYKSSVEKCIDEHGNKLNPKDTNCMSYNPLAICVAGSFKNICQG